MIRTEAAPLRGESRTLTRARRQVWLALWVFLLGFGLGSLWDRAWHVTHPFEDFWSPPHLFIYTMFTVTAFLIARIALTPEVKAAFGPAVRLPGIALELPGVLMLACGGMALVGLAGAFDAIWHTAFGLDETAWSFPHALLGWGTMTLFLGLLACRLALAPERPLAGWTRVIVALLSLSFVVGVLLGPLDNNRTPEMVRQVAALPVLAAEPDFQHTARIYLAWNLTRSHPLFVPLSALAVGIGLALALALVRRGHWLLVVALLATLLSADRRGARYFSRAMIRAPGCRCRSSPPRSPSSPRGVSVLPNAGRGPRPAPSLACSSR